RHLTAGAASAEEAEARVEELAAKIRAALSGRIYSEDGRELPEVVGALLQERNLTLAAAGSCTGGLLTARLTERPGSSAYVDRAWVTYANRAKIEDLGIDAGLIERHGAVSEEVARAMAVAARERARVDIGVSITGIAGPGGGTPEKPVGLVFIGLSGAAGDRVRRLELFGDRDRIPPQAPTIPL